MTLYLLCTNKLASIVEGIYKAAFEKAGHLEKISKNIQGLSVAAKAGLHQF